MNAIEKFGLTIKDEAMYDEQPRAGRVLVGDDIYLFWVDSYALQCGKGESYEDWCRRANAEAA